MSDSARFLFSVICTTCTARLRVRSVAVVGQIVECPRCGSMVLVEPPAGWKPPAEGEPAVGSSSPAGASPLAKSSQSPHSPQSHSATSKEAVAPKTSGAQSPEEAKPAVPQADPASQPQHSQTQPKQSSPAAEAASGQGVPEGKPALGEALPASQPEPEQLADMAEAGLDLTAPGIKLPGETPPPEAAQGESPDRSASPDEVQAWSETAPPEKEETLPEAHSPGWRGVLESRGPLVAMTLAVLVLGGLFWWLAPGWEDATDPLPEPGQQADSSPAHARPDSPLPGTAPAPQADLWQEIGPWVPPGSQMVLVARFPENPAHAAAVEAALHPWQRQFEYPLRKMLEAFSLRREAVQWVCWSVQDPARWNSEALLVVKLRQDLDPLPEQVAQSRPTGRKVAGAQVRQLPSKKWKWPFVLLGPRLLATGAPRLLASLPAPLPVPGNLSPVRRLLALSLQGAGSVCWVFSAAAWEHFPWQLPPAWRNQWPQQQRWEALRAKVQAVAVALQGDHPQRLWLYLCGATPSVNLELQNHLVTLSQGLLGLVQQHLDQLPKRLRAGQIDAARSQAIRSCLEPLCQALEQQQVQLEEDHVSLCWTLTLPVEKLGAVLRAQFPWWDEQIRLAAHRRATDRMAALLPALQAFDKAEGSLPQGAAGSPVLPPQRRLSWIASLLPYLGQEELYRRLSFAHSWDDPTNQPATRKLLPPLLNPLLPRQRSEKGYALTHFVGVGGWGTKSPWAKPDDPDAGLFAYNHRRRLSRLPGGASQTIAVLSVQENLGPWSAGGPATVRGVSGLPLAGGADGFGSGRSGETLALMADGSVRVLSNRIDSQVLRHLVVVNKTPRPQLLAGLAPPLVGPGGRKTPSPAGPDTPANRPEKTPEGEKTAATGSGDPASAPGDESKDPAADPLPPAENLTGVPEPLRLEVSELDFRQLPLEEALRLLAQMAGLELQLDVDSLLAAGVSPEAKVSLKLHRVSLHQALRALAAEWGLRFRIRQGKLLLEAAPQQQDRLVEAHYSIQWLVNSPLGSPENVQQVLRRLVAPGTWTPKGQPGRMSYREGKLHVVHTPAVHRQLQGLLARWQRLRTRPVEARGPTTTWQQARPLLEKKVRLSYRIPVSLRHVAAAMQKQTGMLILIDGRSLRTLGLQPEEPLTVELKDVPLWDALQQVAQRLDLAVVLEDARTVRITSPQVAASQLRLEIYPLWYRWRQAKQRQEQVQHLMEQVQPESWQPQGAGWGYLEPDSGLWIVSQTQEVHLLLEQALAQP